MKVPKTEETGWQKKVLPFYVRICKGYKEIARLSSSPSKKDREKAQQLIRNPPPHLVEEARKLGEKMRKSGGLTYQISKPLGFQDLSEGSQISEGAYMLSWLAEAKYGKTAMQLVQEDKKGNEEASRQVLNVARDYQKWRYGKLRPDDMRSKFHRDHITLMEGGLNFGLVDLTGDELADFFDSFCPCGKVHDQETLRKLRTRVKRYMAKQAPNQK